MESEIAEGKKVESDIEKVGRLVDLLFESVTAAPAEAWKVRRLAWVRAKEIAADPHSITDDERELLRRSKQARSLVRAIRQATPSSKPAEPSPRPTPSVLPERPSRRFRLRLWGKGWPLPARLAFALAVLVV